MKIASLLYREDKWCKNCLATTKNGKKLFNLNVHHFEDGKTLDPSKECNAYSLYGAITHLYNGTSQSEIFSKLSKAIREYKGIPMRVAEFNDSPETTYEDIQKVIKLANL